MTMDLILKMIGCYLMFFGGVYLLVQCMDLIEDYIEHRATLRTLNRIEEKVNQLPGVDKDKEDEWWKAIR